MEFQQVGQLKQQINNQKQQKKATQLRAAFFYLVISCDKLFNSSCQFIKPCVFSKSYSLAKFTISCPIFIWLSYISCISHSFILSSSSIISQNWLPPWESNPPRMFQSCGFRDRPCNHTPEGNIILIFTTRYRIGWNRYIIFVGYSNWIIRRRNS